jgi:hypothetical protein
LAGHVVGKLPQFPVVPKGNPSSVAAALWAAWDIAIEIVSSLSRFAQRSGNRGTCAER